MFEARLTQAGILKKIVDAVKDLVSQANFDCTKEGMSLQAMDSSHVSLVSMLLRKDGFDLYRCDRNNMRLGIDMNVMAKILKCAANDDIVTLKADEDGDTLTFVFESPSNDKVSEFQLKLMDIDHDMLAIPERDYNAVVNMSASEFQRICRDLTILGDTVLIGATNEGVKFTVSGDQGSGAICLKQTESAADSKGQEATTIKLDEEVKLSFALRYLNQFAKATGLSTSVGLSMSKDVPLVVEYKIDSLGYVRYYLAPKIEDEAD